MTDTSCNIARQRSMASVFITMIIILAMIVIAEAIMGADSTVIVSTLGVFSGIMVVLVLLWPGCDE